VTPNPSSKSAGGQRQQEDFESLKLTLVVVREMVPLHLGQILRQPRVVQGVMHAIVKDVEGERSRDDTIRDGRGEDNMREVGEGSLENEEEGRRHDESETIHG